MRTSLSATLTSNQAGVGVTGQPYTPIYKIVLTRDSQDTQTYTKTRIRSISHTEEEDNQTATVLLANSDNALTTIDFEMYKGVISYGYNDPTQGDEYSACAPLYVKGQRLYSAQGILVCQLNLTGIPNLMGMDLALSELTLTDGDVATVEDLITAIAGATPVPYLGYTNYTVTYDSRDSIINSLSPKSSFHIGENENRLDKIKQLLSWTGCKMRVEADGNIHIFDPRSSTPFDYEYKLAVSSEHTFFSKELRNRFVNPNKEVVKSYEADSPQYSSSATSSPSYGYFPETHTTRLKLSSTNEASDIASAIIETYELDAEKGAVKVPMNVGQEVWDYIKVTDSRQGDSRIGNVRFLQRNVQSAPRGGKLVFDMDIRYGKTAISPLPIAGVAGARGEAGGISNQALADGIYWLDYRVEKLEAEQKEIIKHLRSLHDIFLTKKLLVKYDLTIPVQEPIWL